MNNINVSAYQYIKARHRDNREVMNYYGKAYYTDDFYNSIDSVAEYLCNIGVVKGDSVVICLPNTPGAVVAFYAVNKIGAIANIVHPLTPPLGLRKILDAIESKAIFINDVFIRKITDIIPEGAGVIKCSLGDDMPYWMKAPFKFGVGLTIINTTGVKYCKIIKTKPTARSFSDVTGEDTAVYLHSGGTSGEPKTVMLSNRAINAIARNINGLNGENLAPGTSMLMVLPLFHVFGLGVCMHSTIAAGARALILPYFNAKQTCRVMRRQKVTFMTGVPTMYEKMLNCKEFYGDYLKTVRYCYCGGDRLTSKITDAFTAAVNRYGGNAVLSEGYGLTEAGICTVNSADDYKANSVGTPLQDVKIMITDALGNALPFNERGEINIGGSSVMSGYYGDGEEGTFVCGGVKYVRTGDIGYLDESNHLYFVDRIKRMVKISGINVFPSEIEQAALTECDFVRRAAAIGKCSEKGKSFIKLYIEKTDGKKLSDTEKEVLLKKLQQNLIKYAIPREIVSVAKIPLTKLGKTDYKLL